MTCITIYLFYFAMLYMGKDIWVKLKEIKKAFGQTYK